MCDIELLSDCLYERMYVFMYVYMYICMYVCLFVCTQPRVCKRNHWTKLLMEMAVEQLIMTE